jgi:hypothetical protein
MGPPLAQNAKNPPTAEAGAGRKAGYGQRSTISPGIIMYLEQKSPPRSKPGGRKVE